MKMTTTTTLLLTLASWAVLTMVTESIPPPPYIHNLEPIPNHDAGDTSLVPFEDKTMSVKVLVGWICRLLSTVDQRLFEKAGSLCEGTKPSLTFTSPFINTRTSTGPYIRPSEGPYIHPSEGPYIRPSESPYIRPTEGPYIRPSEGPYIRPTEGPYIRPSEGPYIRPTEGPFIRPSEGPYIRPSEGPYIRPTDGPYIRPSEGPYIRPTEGPWGGETPGFVEWKARDLTRRNPLSNSTVSKAYYTIYDHTDFSQPIPRTCSILSRVISGSIPSPLDYQAGAAHVYLELCSNFTRPSTPHTTAGFVTGGVFKPLKTLAEELIANYNGPRHKVDGWLHGMNRYTLIGGSTERLCEVLPQIMRGDFEHDLNFPNEPEYKVAAAEFYLANCTQQPPESTPFPPPLPPLPQTTKFVSGGDSNPLKTLAVELILSYSGPRDKVVDWLRDMNRYTLIGGSTERLCEVLPQIMRGDFEHDLNFPNEPEYKAAAAEFYLANCTQQPPESTPFPPPPPLPPLRAGFAPLETMVKELIVNYKGPRNKVDDWLHEMNRYILAVGSTETLCEVLPQVMRGDFEHDLNLQNEPEYKAAAAEFYLANCTQHIPSPPPPPQPAELGPLETMAKELIANYKGPRNKVDNWLHEMNRYILAVGSTERLCEVLPQVMRGDFEHDLNFQNEPEYKAAAAEFYLANCTQQTPPPPPPPQPAELVPLETMAKELIANYKGPRNKVDDWLHEMNRYILAMGSTERLCEVLPQVMRGDFEHDLNFQNEPEYKAAAAEFYLANCTKQKSESAPAPPPPPQSTDIPPSHGGVQCGRSDSLKKRNSASRSRTMGGEKATSTCATIPWHVRLESEMEPKLCGGSIVGERNILTAAHCVSEIDDPRRIRVVAGDYDKSREEGSEQWRNVTRIIYHDSFGPSTYRNDIAMLVLSEPLQYNSCVKPVCQDRHFMPDGTLCTVSGWGTTAENGPVAEKLQTVQLRTFPGPKCHETFDIKALNYLTMKEKQICAGTVTGGKESCQGDPGGPLVCLNPRTQTFVQVGVVSYGTGCAVDGYPGVYSSVAAFNDWIEEQLAMIR